MVENHNEHDLSTIDVLVDKATDIFWEREATYSGENAEPFQLYQAALEILEEETEDQFNLLAKILRQSKISPIKMETFQFEELANTTSSENLAVSISAIIISEEAKRKHPGVRDEESRRFEIYG